MTAWFNAPGTQHEDLKSVFLFSFSPRTSHHRFSLLCNHEQKTPFRKKPFKGNGCPSAPLNEDLTRDVNRTAPLKGGSVWLGHLREWQDVRHKQITHNNNWGTSFLQRGRSSGGRGRMEFVTDGTACVSFRYNGSTYGEETPAQTPHEQLQRWGGDTGSPQLTAVRLATVLSQNSPRKSNLGPVLALTTIITRSKF